MIIPTAPKSKTNMIAVPINSAPPYYPLQLIPIYALILPATLFGTIRLWLSL